MPWWLSRTLPLPVESILYFTWLLSQCGTRELYQSQEYPACVLHWAFFGYVGAAIFPLHISCVNVLTRVYLHRASLNAHHTHTETTVEPNVRYYNIYSLRKLCMLCFWLVPLACDISVCQDHNFCVCLCSLVSIMIGPAQWAKACGNVAMSFCLQATVSYDVHFLASSSAAATL